MHLEFSSRLDPSTVDASRIFLVSGGTRPAITLSYDPVVATLDVRPAQSLDPSVTYRLILDGVEDLDGHRLSEDPALTFRTGEDLGVAQEAEPCPSWVEASVVLATRCAAAACHSAEASAGGLDLATAEGVARTAFATPGGGSLEPVRGSGLLARFPVIDVVAGEGRPETSYLVYKLLGDNHIRGEPMPPPAGLERRQTRLLAGWIRCGAPTTDGDPVR